MSRGAISKNQKRIASKQNLVSAKTMQKPPKGKFGHLAKGWDFLTKSEKRDFSQGGQNALPDDFKMCMAHTNSHMYQISSEKQEFNSSVAEVRVVTPKNPTLLRARRSVMHSLLRNLVMKRRRKLRRISLKLRITRR
jgi:hypothetical protein